MDIYFYIKTDCLENTWNTVEILRFLRLYSIFTEKPDGIFISQKPFIMLSLMKVKEINSWSSHDFDSRETNYVSIVTSETGYESAVVKDFLKELEIFLGFRVCRDES